MDIHSVCIAGWTVAHREGSGEPDLSLSAIPLLGLIVIVMDSNPQPGLYTAPMELIEKSEFVPRHISLEPLMRLAGVGTQNGAGGVSERKRVGSGEKPTRKRVGRKISKVNQILRSFRREQISRTYQPPKLENVRYRVMRTLKKVLRRLEKGKALGSKGLLALNYTAGPAAASFEAFTDFARSHADAISEFSEISNGPKVDKGKLKAEHESRFFTYNNSYMEHIFSVVEVRTVYRLFVKFVFSDDRPSSLNDRFRIWCCTSTSHDLTCVEKWRSFRTMLDQYLGANLPDEVKNEPVPWPGSAGEDQSLHSAEDARGSE